MRPKLLPLLLPLLLLTGCTAPTLPPTPTVPTPTAAVTATRSPTTASTASTASTEPPEATTYRQVSVQEAMELMASGDGYIILDVRRPDEYAAGHIPNAVNLPNERIGNGDIPALPDKGQLILVYCRSGRRSKEASDKLVRLGYTNVVEFGGILDWPGEVET